MITFKKKPVAQVAQKQIAKPKVVSKVASKASGKEVLHSERAKLADQLGSLDEQIALIKKQTEKLNKERTHVESKLLIITETGDAEQDFVIEGANFVVSIGQKGNESAIVDRELAIKFLEGIQKGLFMKVGKLGVGDLKTYLPQEQYNIVVSVERKGKRPIKAIRKGAA